MRLIDAAADAGFWGVKTQAYRITSLFSPEALEARPDLHDWPELPEDWHEELAARAHERGLVYGVSIFHPDSIGALQGVADFWKVSSYDILRSSLLRDLGASGKPVVVSTGMATMDEVQEARQALMGAGASEMTFLHCVSSYPCPPTATHLGVIDTMQKAICWPIGWSDHTVDREVVERAVWRWRASMVELHFDLEDARGSESAHSWREYDAKRLISKLSDVMPEELAWISPLDGTRPYRKEPHACELKEREWRADPGDGMRPMREVRPRIIGAR